MCLNNKNNSSPKYMNEVFTSADKSQIKTRASSYKLKQPNCKKVSGYRTISYLGPKLWNRLPNDIKSAESVNSFKHRIKKHVLLVNLIERTRKFLYTTNQLICTLRYIIK